MVESLVTWREPTEIGMLAGSEWVIPSLEGDYPGLRPRHLEAVRYLEGYIAAYAVDSVTGEKRTDPEHSYRFSGMYGRGDLFRYVPSFTVTQTQPPIDIGDGKQIRSVRNHDFVTETHIEPADAGRPFTRVIITPERKMLFVEGEGKIGKRGYGFLNCQQGNVGPEPRASLVVGMARDGSKGRERLCADLDANGQLRNLRTRKGMLKKLGFRKLAKQFDFEYDWTSISDRSQQTDIMNSVAEMLGMDEWRGLDLRLSAAGLYANLGKPDLDIAKVLVQPGSPRVG